MSNPIQASLLRCAALGISVYSPHSALDSVWGGVNDWLADGVLGGDKEAGAVTSLVARGETTDDGGDGRLVTLSSPIGMDVLEDRIKSHLSLSQSEYTIAFLIHRPSPSILMFRNKLQFKWGTQPFSVLHRIIGLPSGPSPSVLVLAGPCSWASRQMYILRGKCHM
jgi:hypothetical protein